MDRLARALAVAVAVLGLMTWASPACGEDLVAQADAPGTKTEIGRRI